eukprot:m.349473 g.349473  ORF g.349473 m.349473 type:complete len:57 (+) comp27951_c1_seq1:1125-1295(+)
MIISRDNLQIDTSVWKEWQSPLCGAFSTVPEQNAPRQSTWLYDRSVFASESWGDHA